MHAKMVQSSPKNAKSTVCLSEVTCTQPIWVPLNDVCNIFVTYSYIQGQKGVGDNDKV